MQIIHCLVIKKLKKIKFVKIKIFFVNVFFNFKLIFEFQLAIVCCF